MIHAVMDVWQQTHWDENLLGLAGIVIACGTIWRYVITPMRHGWQRVISAITIVEKQLTPNGGGSLLDKVTRVDERVGALEARNVEARTRSTDERP